MFWSGQYFKLHTAIQSAPGRDDDWGTDNKVNMSSREPSLICGVLASGKKV